MAHIKNAPGGGRKQCRTITPWRGAYPHLLYCTFNLEIFSENIGTLTYLGRLEILLPNRQAEVKTPEQMSS